FRQLLAKREGPLQGGVNGVAILGRLVDTDAATRLHAGSGHAVDDEALLDDTRGARERRVVAALSPSRCTKQILSGQSSKTSGAPGAIASAVETTAGNSWYSTSISSAASAAW